MTDAVIDAKRASRVVWASGNWDLMSEMIAAVGPRLLDRVGTKPGIDLLDVGTGSGGTLSIPAAQRGARVVGSDLTPELFDDARRRAADAEVMVEWVEADAEDLPFGDASFDRVLSTFGHMFAPRHKVAAAEMARVCRPGGIIGFAAWTPDGMAGEMFKIVGGYMPPPPDFAQPPVLWGTEEHVREMFEPLGIELEFERTSVRFEQESAADLVRFYEENFGPIVTARGALGERWPQLRDDLTQMLERRNEADDGSLSVGADYLVTIGQKRG